MSLEPRRPALTDVSQLQIPGMEGLWRRALLVSEEMVDRLLKIGSREEADELIPQEILVNPHQLALELEGRESESER